MVPIAWSRYLGGDAVPSFLKAFAPHTAASGSYRRAAGAPGVGVAAAAGGVSLESVLELSKRTAGSAVDADAPLMEAGVDSLGAVELRNQLQRAAGSSVALPSTIVFDHPTARSLAVFLAPRADADGSTHAAAHAAAHADAHGPTRAVRPSFSASVTTSVCGLSSAMPASVTLLRAAWHMTSSGSDTISEVRTAEA